MLRNIAQAGEGDVISHEQCPVSGRLLKNSAPRHDCLRRVKVKDRIPVRIFYIFGVINQITDEE